MKSNWSENINFSATNFCEPATVTELQQVIATARKVSVVGAGHSFNDICDTNGTLISLRKLNRVVEIDAVGSIVTAEGGILLYELAHALETAGLALHNLPSLPHFSAVGACATGTHGSGDTNQCLAAAIRGLEIVTHDGELVEVPADELPAIAIGLGAFGPVARVKLAVEPTYMMAQEIHLEIPKEAAILHVDEVLGSAYSVSYFTEWQHGHVEQIWRKHRLETPAGPIPEAIDDYFGARRASQRMTPAGIDTSGILHGTTTGARSVA